MTGERSVIHILAILALLILSSDVWSEDCNTAVELYNQATQASGLEAKERGFKEAATLCSDPEIISRVYNNLADTYEQGGHLSLALTYYKKALEIKPDLAISYFSVGDIFFRLKDYYSAAVMYGKGLRHGPEDKESWQKKKEAETRAKVYLVIFFDFDSYKIPVRYLRRLNTLVKHIKEHGSDSLQEVRVIGHTCTLGPTAYNRHLSLKRAEEAAGYLQDKLLMDSGVVIVTAKGEDIPLLYGIDRNSYALNRRVEIRISFREG